MRHHLILQLSIASRENLAPAVRSFHSLRHHPRTESLLVNSIDEIVLLDGGEDVRLPFRICMAPT